MEVDKSESIVYNNHYKSVYFTIVNISSSTKGLPLPKDILSLKRGLEMTTPETSPKQDILQDIVDLLETFPAETIQKLLQEWHKEALESGWMPAGWYRQSPEQRHTKTWKKSQE